MPPVHPGEILKGLYLDPLNLSITAAAKGLHVSRKQLSEVVNAIASISVEMALRLKKGFGLDAERWLDMQKDYDLWKVEKSGRIPDIHRRSS